MTIILTKEDYSIGLNNIDAVHIRKDQILEVEFKNDIDAIKAHLKVNGYEYITYSDHILLIGHCYDEIGIL